MENRNSGQALTEFLLSIMMIVPLLVGAGHLLMSCWERIPCEVRLFQQTRDFLETPEAQDVLMAQASGVFLKREAGVVSGEVKCGKAIRRLRLPEIPESDDPFKGFLKLKNKAKHLLSFQ
ncbi:hypothetical protein WDW86_17530 [Bdellovibrionota bacterium FG-2]